MTDIRKQRSEKLLDLPVLASVFDSAELVAGCHLSSACRGEALKAKPGLLPLSDIVIIPVPPDEAPDAVCD